ncbi:cytochrome ubiquinol oxidase subunit I, partial [Francisellaceae bacterium]|nr:cytochrome ubiquinol oxidase subunit I [Francisellaceae bacterium]
YVAFNNMVKIRQDNATEQEKNLYEANKENLGFGFLYHYVNGENSELTPAGVEATKVAAIPDVPIAFWSFRVMLAMWGIMLLALIIVVYKIYRNKPIKRYLLWGLLLIIPVPYIAVEAGWVLCENGRQPWIVHEMMPTGIGSSLHDTSTLVITLIGFVLIYVTLFVVELFLMFKYARLGPKSYLPDNKEEE